MKFWCDYNFVVAEQARAFAGGYANTQKLPEIHKRPASAVNSLLLVKLAVEHYKRSIVCSDTVAIWVQ